MDETGRINYFLVKPHSDYNGEKGWKRGRGSEFTCIHTQLAIYTCLNGIKKEARQVNQKFFEFKKGEYRDRQHA